MRFNRICGKTVLFRNVAEPQKVAKLVKVEEANNFRCELIASKRALRKQSRVFIDLTRQMSACRRCGLGMQRRRTVFGHGNRRAPPVMFVGDIPGFDGEAQGRAFASMDGKELRRLCAAAGITYKRVFMTNIYKCRPLKNSTPSVKELVACFSWLRKQITCMQPKAIVAFGTTAAAVLMQKRDGMATQRGKWHRFMGVPLLYTYHPAYCLRYPPARKDTLVDLKKVAQRVALATGMLHSKNATDAKHERATT